MKPTEYDITDAMWLPRPSHKKPCTFHLGLLECYLWGRQLPCKKSSRTAMLKGSPREPCGERCLTGPQQFQISQLKCHTCWVSMSSWMSNSDKPSEWLQPQVSCNSMRPPFPYENSLTKISQSTKSQERIIDCFKLLSLGMICYAIDNQKYILTNNK